MTDIGTATRKILNRSTTKGTEPYAAQWFIQVDPDDNHIHSEVYLSFTDFEDMGRPDQITITIEPGDTLN